MTNDGGGEADAVPFSLVVEDRRRGFDPRAFFY
jgi:hypothetical protein